MTNGRRFYTQACVVPQCLDSQQCIIHALRKSSLVFVRVVCYCFCHFTKVSDCQDFSIHYVLSVCLFVYVCAYIISMDIQTKFIYTYIYIYVCIYIYIFVYNWCITTFKYCIITQAGYCMERRNMSLTIVLRDPMVVQVCEGLMYLYVCDCGFSISSVWFIGDNARSHGRDAWSCIYSCWWAPLLYAHICLVLFLVFNMWNYICFV